ncbi:MAG: hypothetical protein VW644_04650 [Alphaproteobacteria bacterium]
MLGERFDRSPLGDAGALARFCRTRAAYVAQTSLYGYLRTRMGTEYRRHFEDDAFAASMRIATAKLFASCLADLAVFTVATAARDGNLPEAECVALAAYVYRTAYADGMADVLPDEAPDREAAFAGFDARLAGTDWAAAADGEAAFSGSAADLVRYAPVIDEFKRYDGEIVRNSIRFRWRDVREQARKRIDGAALAAAARSGDDRRSA